MSSHCLALRGVSWRLTRLGDVFRVMCLFCHVTLRQTFLPSDLFPNAQHLFLPVSVHPSDLIFDLGQPPLVLCCLVVRQFFPLVSEGLVLKCRSYLFPESTVREELVHCLRVWSWGASHACSLGPQLESSWFSVCYWLHLSPKNSEETP